jgi:hypothetical protein
MINYWTAYFTASFIEYATFFFVFTNEIGL